MDTAQIPKDFMNSGGGGGVSMMSNTWRDEQHPSFINFISACLAVNSFRLNFVPISPDFIFNCRVSSVAFVFVTSLESTTISQLFGRVEKLKMQFPTLCVVITLPTMEQDDLFVHSSLKFGMELGMPMLVLVKDLEVGFKKLTEIAQYCGGGGGGVCMMSNTWRDEQHPSFINFISACLAANTFRLNFVPISPDFIFNCGGSSVAFVFVTSLESTTISQPFGRVEKLNMQFPTLCVVITLPTMEQDDLFVHSSLKFGMELGMPTLVLVKDLEVGFKKIMEIAQYRGVCKQEDVTAQLKAERKQTMQAQGIFQRVIKAIPGIHTHDANAEAKLFNTCKEHGTTLVVLILEAAILVGYDSRSTDNNGNIVSDQRTKMREITPKICLARCGDRQLSMEIWQCLDTVKSNHEASSTPLTVTDLAKSGVVAIEKSDDIQKKIQRCHWGASSRAWTMG